MGWKFNPFTGTLDITGSSGGGGSVTAVTASGPLSSSGGATPNISITDASAIDSGVVTTGTQTFAGNKTFTGTITASNLSGTNTGDQTITLTGDVTGSGTGSFATTISNNVVTNAKLAQMPALTIKGNNTGSTADAMDLTVAQVNAILPVFTTTLNGLVPAPGTTSSLIATLLGASSNFTILANTTITSTGNTVIIGDLGLSPGTSVTGFPPGIVTGLQHINDATAATGQSTASSAYSTLAGMTPTANETGIDLGTLTLTPGVYKFDTTAQLTGTLTLDASGDPNAQWVFQIGSTLTTAASSSVVFVDGVGSSSNVCWQIGTSATFGASNAFKGNLFANVTITVGAGTSIDGRLIALTGAITLDNNIISPFVASDRFLRSDGTWIAPTGATGTVSSVALADSSTTPIYNVSGSPITTSGQLTLTLANQSANTVFAGPTSGGASQPTFRALVTADMPAGVSTKTPNTELFTLNGTDITNGFITLSASPTVAAEAVLIVRDAPGMFFGDDFTVTGAQLDWNGLALDGLLSSGDELTVIYYT